MLSKMSSSFPAASSVARRVSLLALPATLLAIPAAATLAQGHDHASHAHVTGAKPGVVELLENWDHSVPFIRDAEDGGVYVGDIYFDSWDHYFMSDLFQEQGLRCGTPYEEGFLDPQGPSDCSYNNTNPDAQYDPSVALFRIPVVFHILRADNGVTGDVSEELINSQIDVLNEDFLAILGSNGGNGTDCQIEFYLATVDPDGNPTDGITRSNNTTWYNDRGGYYNTLAWDPDRYLNVYTNTASGALGYVPFLPQNGNVGSNEDRVVVLYSTVGKNAPYGFPYNLGRTLTHEVGHYLGLFHTFQGGCSSNCSTTGDRICDTNPESSPNFGCGSRSTCGNPDPIDNYMDYSDDRCMEQFTPDQARRMRCTMEFYRPDVYSQGNQEFELTVSQLVGGQSADFTVTGADSNAVVAILWGNQAGSKTFNDVYGWCATFEFKVPSGKAQSRIVGQGIANSSGTYTTSKTIPSSVAGKTFFFQGAQKYTCPDEKMTQVETRTVQ